MYKKRSTSTLEMAKNSHLMKSRYIKKEKRKVTCKDLQLKRINGFKEVYSIDTDIDYMHLFP